MNIHIKKEFGNAGELIAVEYLKKQGYEILDRNFYCRQGEIDIVAIDKDEIVFIEVKARSNLNFGKPAEAVNNIKQKHLIRTAKYFLYKMNFLDRLIRFDVIEVLIKDGRFNINHIRQII